jgi:hypothetical protein
VSPVARALVPLALMASALAGCSDDDGSAPRNPHSSALAETLFRGDVGTEEAVSDDARECVAAEFVDAVGGPDALQERGITPADLGAAEDLATLDIPVGDREAARVADALEPCGVSTTDLLLVDFGDVPADVRRCVEERVDDDALRSFVVSAILDERAEVSDREVVDSLLVCFPE